jgi:hypothetical protein
MVLDLPDGAREGGSVLPCHCQLDVPFVHEQKDPAGTPGIETWNLSHDAGFHPMPEQWEVS